MRIAAVRHLNAFAAVAIATVGLAAPPPSFPGAWVRARSISANLAARECLSLGDEMYDSTAAEVGGCRAPGLQNLGRAGGVAWVHSTYERRWLISATDTAAERELVLFRKQSSRDSATLQPVWHYRYEPEILASVTPAVAPLSGGRALLSIDECVNGTGGCSQSLAILARGSPKTVKLVFLESLDRRFPGAIRHGFHVDVRTLRGSLALYTDADPNCCPSKIGEFSLRLRGDALELVTLKVRRTE